MVRPMVRRLRGLCALLAVAALLPAEPAWGYEFWTRARTTGEAYELRGFRLVGGELAIGRRRLTHTLTLVLHDLGDLARKRRRAGRWLRGPVVSWHGTLRFDHDFGTFITGRLDAGPTMRQDALDLIPELEDSAFALSLLYGHLRIDGLWNDRLRLALGRIAPLSADGALPFDGAELRMQVTDHVEVVVSGGLAVREASWLGVAAYELDGTPGASCHEYVEAAQGQPGRWRLIERGERVVDGRFSSDFELCPQRQVRMPTASLSLVTQEISGVSAQLGYRVTELERRWARAHPQERRAHGEPRVALAARGRARRLPVHRVALATGRFSGQQRVHGGQRRARGDMAAQALDAARAVLRVRESQRLRLARVLRRIQRRRRRAARGRDGREGRDRHDGHERRQGQHQRGPAPGHRVRAPAWRALAAHALRRAHRLGSSESSSTPSARSEVSPLPARRSSKSEWTVTPADSANVARALAVPPQLAQLLATGAWVVVVTEDATDFPTVTSLLGAGVRDVVAVPYRPEDVVRKIARLILRKRRRT